MRTKKLFLLMGSIFLVLLLVLPFFVACEGTTDGDGDEAETVRIGGIPAEWLGYRICDSLIAESIGRFTPYSVKVVGGYSHGLDRYEAYVNGDVHLGIDVQGYWASEAVIAELDPELLEEFNYQVVIPNMWTPMPLYVTADTPIDSLADVIEQQYPLRIVTGRIGSYLLVDQIFRAAGAPNGVMSLEDWGGKVENTVGTEAAPDLIREGVMDAYMGMGGEPDAKLEELNAVVPMKAVPTLETPEQLAQLTAVCGGIGRGYTEPEWYSFVTERVPCPGLLRCYIAGSTLSDEMAYDIASAVWEDRLELSIAFYEYGRVLTEEFIAQMYAEMNVPFHPGSLSFWKDIGIIK